jgi:uroporphyrinogen-III synthase
MLEKEMASVIRCPMFAILDTPNPEPCYQWIERFIKKPFDIFIILTGEGLFRLTCFAENKGLKSNFIVAVAATKTLIRGPKPRKALSAIGLTPDMVAQKPTTEGVILTLSELDLSGLEIGIQLYGEEPNLKLIEYVKSMNAIPVSVAPYIYAPQSDDEKVIDILKSIQNKEIDLIAFTSNEQVKRMKKVAELFDAQIPLKNILNCTAVAAVGPVVLRTLQEEGVHVKVTPADSYFLKPMVNEIKKFFINSKL